MTVDELRQLHLDQSHFFSEQAPGDAIAELGVFGAPPSSPTFGGTRMGTNAPDHPPVEAHSSYFEPGSEALENMVDVVTGEYDEIVRHRAAFPEIAGGLVAWALRMPAVPLRMAGRHYRGPGFRLLTNWCRLVDLGASETGNLVCEVLDESERALLWFAHRVGALPHPDGVGQTKRHPVPRTNPAPTEPVARTTSSDDPTMASMDVVITEKARDFATARGGVVYVRSHSHRCCSGPITLLDTTTEEPADWRDYTGVTAGDLTVRYRGTPRPVRTSSPSNCGGT